MRLPSATTKGGQYHRERGGSFPEAVIVTPCFLIVVMMSIQFMFISFRAVTLQWITTQAMRDIALWKNGPRETDTTKVATESFNYALGHATTLGQSIGVSLRDVGSQKAFCVKNITNSPTLCLDGGAWNEGDTVQLQLTYTIPLFFTRLLFVNIPTQTVTGTALAIIENPPAN